MSQAILLNQLAQLKNPDSRIVMDQEATKTSIVKEYAGSFQGISTADDPQFVLFFWGLLTLAEGWELLQDAADRTELYVGRTLCIRWTGQDGLLQKNEQGIGAIRGRKAWGKVGVSVARMRELYVTVYRGNLFKTSNFAIVPDIEKTVAAIWCFASDRRFGQEVRRLNQALAIDNGIAQDLPFDLDYWQKVAEERYPDGLPDPHSDAPTQWLFRGDIPSSTEPLQAAMARLLGYRWPGQPEDDPDDSATFTPPLTTDDDGIVTLAPLVNQEGVASRLRAILQAAYESDAPPRSKGAPVVEELREWNENVIPRLLARSGSSGITLEEWLRDKFFDAHAKLFQQRPFLWHLWDGRKDGFHAFVNYHKLDRKNLERLTHVYLGEWIERQKAASDSGDRTADGRLVAAQELQRKLELIRLGEPPYDIFVRWKGLHEQPMGWDPDLNDGVRMNIRPFVETGILHGKVNVNWNKDRGKDPKLNVSGTVERHNDLHFTLAEKRVAREGKIPS